MRASAPSRILLALSGLALAVLADRDALVIAVGVLGAGFLLTGQTPRAIAFVGAVMPFVLIAGGLWLYVNGKGVSEEGLAQLVDPNSPFLRLLRAIAGSGALVLAIATVPDGEFRTFMTRLGFPSSIAFAVASGLALYGVIGEAFTRSLTALRAQGLVGPGRFSALVALGPVLALTWVSILNTVVARSELKWFGNGFAEAPEPPDVRATVAVLWGNLVLTGTTAGIAIALVKGGEIVSHIF